MNTPETKAKLSGANNGMWKGDKAGKIAMHIWVARIKGPAKTHKCVDCGKQARDWSNNNNHVYRRKLSDYSPRCASCHRKYDYYKSTDRVSPYMGLMNPLMISETLNSTYCIFIPLSNKRGTVTSFSN